MWWTGVLPTMGIICATLVTPQIINYYLCKLVQKGNPYRRDLSHPTNLNLYWRDIRLSGSPYVMQGLSNIPDADGGSDTYDDSGGTNENQEDGKTNVFTDPSCHTTPCPTKDK